MKVRDPKVELLQRLPGLDRVKVRDLADVAPLVDEVRVEAGTVLEREGDTCHEVALIVEGTATVTAGDAVLGSLGPGDLVGDLALLEGAPFAATTVAATPMRLLVAGPETNRALLHHPAVRRCATNSLSGRLRRSDEQLAGDDG